MKNIKDSKKTARNRRIKKSIIRISINTFALAGFAILYYLGFSLFFDTPVERELRLSTQMLREEYTLLTQRYDSLDMVIQSVTERDKSIFRTLFESDPYDLESEYMTNKMASYESLLPRSYSALEREFTTKISDSETSIKLLNESYHKLQSQVDSYKKGLNNIPSIQPIINSDLTLITASFGMLMHPFYKTLRPHQGVDFAIPEGTSIFATADGVVKQTYIRNSTAGQTISIDHGNGYETYYSHLSKINVRRGERVHQGDIIALSGNTGLSLAPHLHYEVRHNDLRVDPIYYFFKELTPDESQRIIRIAQQGMQSFD